MEDNVDAADRIDLDSDVDMEKDGDDDEEEDEAKEDEEEVEEEDEDDEEDQDEDDGKEPQMLGHGEMVKTLADDVDTMVYNQPLLLPEQDQEMREHTPRTQPPAPNPRPQTPEPSPRPRTLVTRPVSGMEHLWHFMPQKPRPAVPTLREDEAAGNTSDVDVDVDVDQQMLIELAGGNSLPDVALPDVHLADVPYPDVGLPDVPLREAGQDWSVGEE